MHRASAHAEEVPLEVLVQIRVELQLGHLSP